MGRQIYHDLLRKSPQPPIPMNHHVLTFTANDLLGILQSLPVANAYVVGFSGGADSTALLHALNSIQSQLDVSISAVHVNHGLHDDADHWQRQCENFCQHHEIALTCVSVDLQHCSGKGLEAEARHLRYEAITAMLEPGACLLTAHHADDQSETLLLNLMRGSGVDGLSAMPDSRNMGHGLLQRPLLGYQNSALRDYLRVNNIMWTEDPSNQQLNHDRNFVRHELIPLLEKRWPQVSKRLLLTRQAMASARHLLENLADETLNKNLLHPLVLKISAPIEADPDLFKLVTRRWMKLSDAPSIPAYRLESFCNQVRQAGTDHNVTVAWDGWVLRLYQQQLWLDTDRNLSPCPAIEWQAGQSHVELGDDIGRLVLANEDQVRSEPRPSLTPEGAFSVGARIDIVESVISQGRYHKSLKNLFQTAAIPPWLRDCIPLCKLDGEVVAMGDWCYSEQFAGWMSEHHVRLIWQPHHPLLQFILQQQHTATVDPAGAVR